MRQRECFIEALLTSVLSRDTAVAEVDRLNKRVHLLGEAVSRCSATAKKAAAMALERQELQKRIWESVTRYFTH